MSLHRSNPYSLGKRCTICGGHVLNVMKVLTCQECRGKQAEAKKKAAAPRRTAIYRP